MAINAQTSSQPKVGRPCPKCNERTPPGAQFCGKCGYRFVDLGQTMHSAPKLKLPSNSVAEPSQIPESSEGPAVQLGPLGPLPRMLGKYRVETKIGAGGMGCVYKAVDTSLSRTVAIKTLTPEVANDPQARQRFEREARTIAALEHPNITGIYFLEAEGSIPYYAMEYVEGESLEDRIQREGRLTPLDCCRLLAQASKALAAAAAAGVVHRDIKPSNLLLRARDGILKVTDFGLAKPQADKALTGAQVVVGTPLYMSPEQAMGKQLDFRSDLYSLGVTFYHALSGAPPFDDESAVGVMLKHLKEPLPPLSAKVPEAPQALVDLVHKMLAKEAANRYASYEEFISALATVAAAFRKSPGSLTTGKTPISRSAALVPAPPAAPAVANPPEAAASRADTALEESASRVPAMPAPPAAFWGRTWQVMAHPWSFFRDLPSSEGLSPAVAHLSLVGLLAAGETALVAHGHGVRYLLAFLVVSGLMGTAASAGLKLRLRDTGFRDGFKLACYAMTPCVIGGGFAWKLNMLYSLALMAVGVIAHRRGTGGGN